jgi:hypothetical protein
MNYTSRCVGKLVCPSAAFNTGPLGPHRGHIRGTNDRTAYTRPHPLVNRPTDARQTPVSACQREGPGRCRQQRRDLGGDWGASVSGRQRRLERRLPRRLWRSRWARRFPIAEPACLAISSRKARSGSHRISKRHPTSSHHKDRVHTLAPRPTRGIGFNGGTGGTKKRPACARRSASVALFGHTPTTTCRSVTIGQAIGQVRWSTAVDLPAVAAASGQSGHRRPLPRSLPPSGRGAGQGCVALVRAGSVGHRKPLVPGGHKRSVSANENRRSQARQPLRPGPPKQHGTGFESHLLPPGLVPIGRGWGRPPGGKRRLATPSGPSLS